MRWYEMQKDGVGKQANRFYEKGLKYYDESNYEKAVEQFTKAANDAPMWALPLYYRGMANCAMGKYPEGIEDFGVATGLDPMNVDAFFWKGVACQHNDQPYDATISLCNALRIDPTRADISDRVRKIWAIEDPYEVVTRIESFEMLGSHHPTRLHIEVSFEENDKEQSKPVLKEYPAEKKDLSMVALPPAAKDYISRITNIIQHPELAKKCKLRRSAGAIFEGPNGTGKTETAFSLAGQLGWNIVTVSFGGVASKWLGQTEGNIARIFGALENSGYLPAVVLFDEIDSLVRFKDSESRSFECGIVSAFINEINKLNSSLTGHKEIFVIGTTNHIGLIDASIIRSGRLDCIAMPLPDVVVREEIFRIHFKDKPATYLDYKTLAYKTDGCSGADIASLANEVSYRVFENQLNEGSEVKITMGVLENIINERRKVTKLPGYA
jgi:SpoVK/Ycf46/Vps4 family AAA+-type ATPase